MDIKYKAVSQKRYLLLLLLLCARVTWEQHKSGIYFCRPLNLSCPLLSENLRRASLSFCIRRGARGGNKSISSSSLFNEKRQREQEQGVRRHSRIEQVFDRNIWERLFQITKSESAFFRAFFCIIIFGAEHNYGSKFARGIVCESKRCWRREQKTTCDFEWVEGAARAEMER